MAFGDFTVTRSTTKWVLNSAGVLSEVAINTPAFEFNTDGTYRGLLVEPAATNLALYSNDFSNAAWAKISQGTGSVPVVTPNYTTAPDGTNTGWRLQCNLNGGTTTSDRSWLQQSIVGTSVPVNCSVWAKLNSAGTATFSVTVNDTASVTITSTDWVRVGTTRTSATANYTFRIGLIGGSGTSDSIDISIAFAQLETGSVATSYIPTVASTANRTADSVTLTGASSLIGQTHGTLYVELEKRLSGATSIAFQVSDGSTSNLADVRFNASNQPSALVNSGGGAVASITGSAVSANTVYKYALAYALNDFALYQNGSSVGTDVSGATFAATVSRIDIGQNLTNAFQLNGWIRSVALFPSRLANATLATLTT